MGAGFEDVVVAVGKDSARTVATFQPKFITSHGPWYDEVHQRATQINVSPDLNVSSYLQYDDQSGSVGTNTRLRWTFHPRGDLFLVYDHNLREVGTLFIPLLLLLCLFSYFRQIHR